MKRSLMRFGMLGAMVMVAAPLFAQEAASKEKPATVVMTGCVAIGDKAGEYVLANPKAEAAAAASPSSPSAAPGNPDTNTAGKVMSYPLIGGDLKGHVGHTVAVTGTLDDYKPSNSAHQMPGATAMMAADAAASALHVKSVKMVASSCS